MNWSEVYIWIEFETVVIEKMKYWLTSFGCSSIHVHVTDEELFIWIGQFPKIFFTLTQGKSLPFESLFHKQLDIVSYNLRLQIQVDQTYIKWVSSVSLTRFSYKTSMDICTLTFTFSRNILAWMMVAMSGRKKWSLSSNPINFSTLISFSHAYFKKEDVVKMMIEPWWILPEKHQMHYNNK